MTEKLSPPVSVVIPVYNRSDLAPRAIRSALNQNTEPLEIIVADNGSDVDLRNAIEP